MTGVLFGTDGAGVAAVIIVVVIGIEILNFAATFKIITKAGYSGWWILLPLTPVITTAIAFGVLVHEESTAFSTTTTSLSTYLTTVIAYWIITGICALLNWIFFLVFAFSDWPVRRQLRRAGGMLSPMPYNPKPPGPVPTSAMVPASAMAYASASAPSSVAPMQAPANTGPLCPSCLRSTRPGSTFCGSCGQALIGASATPRFPAHAVYDEPMPAGFVAPVSAGAADAITPPPIHAPRTDPTTVLPSPTYPDETAAVPVVSTFGEGLDAATGVIPPIDADPPQDQPSASDEMRADDDATQVLEGAPVVDGALTEPPPREVTESPVVSGHSDDDEVVCPSCAAHEPPLTAFCGQCGTRLGMS